jgi:three-Cys-motif partner protein
MSPVSFDPIGYWSELKLEIVKKYAAAYSTILSAQKALYHLYVDAYAGAGVHVSRTSGEMVPGSPLNALEVRPPFREYHLIDMDAERVEGLRALVGARSDVHFYPGDCNTILIEKVFPRIRYEDFRRALVLLDPYGLHLQWGVVRTAGSLRTIDMFLNFPVMDMNRNVLWERPERVGEDDVARMTAFWGDDSWRQVAYPSAQGNLFGGADPVKGSMDTIVQAYRERLRKVAGFRHVPEPLPMRNSTNAIVYYLFFASQNDTADRVVKDIFDHYKNRPGA